jgi:flagellar biosynthetic protein FliO
MNSVELLPAMVKIFSALAIVIGIMVISLFVAKKVLRRTEGRCEGTDVIKILSTRYVGPKSSIMVVDVAGKVLVVGLSPQNLSLLTSIDDQQSIDRLRPSHGMAGKSSPFAQQLALYTGRLLSVCRFEGRNGRENA